MPGKQDVESMSPYTYERYGRRTMVTLESTDGDWFDVEKPILTESSTFFRHLFALPQPKTKSAIQPPSGLDTHAARSESESTENPRKRLRSSGDATLAEESRVLELDVSSKDLGLFLDLLHSLRFVDFFDARHLRLDIDEIEAIYSVVDRFDVDLLRAGLDRRLHALAPRDPWRVLRLASDRNDIDLARVAIRALTPQHIHRTASNSSRGIFQVSRDDHLRQSISTLQPIWQLELINQLVMRKFSSYSGVHVTGIDMDFEAIAARFDPHSVIPEPELARSVTEECNE